MRITGRLRILFVILGSVTLIHYLVEIVLCNQRCCHLLEISKNENITYVLQKSGTEPNFTRNFLPMGDYHSLIDLSFSFTSLNPICEDITPLLLILVHSAPNNFKKRKVIRDTWGKSTDNIKILFVLGKSHDKFTENELHKENRLNNDLLQGNFIDSYRNMTYKHTMCLKYVVYHCPQAKYVLKVDDDTCVNLPFLTHFLTTDLSPYGAQNLLMCNVITKAKAYRGFRSKWRVTFDEYEYRFFPTYCIGWYILYSPDVILQLYREVQRSEYFWIDDVHVTGLIPEKLNLLVHTDISALTLSKSDMKSIKNHCPLRECRRFLFGKADMDENEIRLLWEHIVNNPVPMSIQNS